MAYIELKEVCIDFPIPRSKLNPGLKRSLIHTIGGKFKSSVGASYLRALDKITLQLTKGDRVGLVGHNGAGKTTLLRVLAGVYPPSFGEIKCVRSLILEWNCTLNILHEKQTAPICRDHP